MPDFATITPTDAAALVVAPDGLDERRRLVGARTLADPDAQPDHWQDGWGVTAPMPDAADPNGKPYERALKAAFVVEDCATDVWTRKVRGLLGKTPHWSIEPDRDTDGQADPMPKPGTVEASELVARGVAKVVGGKLVKAQLDPEEMEAAAVEQALRSWAARQAGGQGLVSVLKEWAGGMALVGRDYLRLRVPRGMLRDVAETTPGPDGQPVETVTRRLVVSTPEEALRAIVVEHAWPDQGTVYTDRDTMRSLGVAVFSPADDGHAGTQDAGTASRVETVYVADGTDEGEAEGLTVIRTARGTESDAVALDLGGRLTLFEGRMAPTVTPSVVSNQRDLNTSRTMSALNSHNAGFPEVVFTDIEPPEDEAGNAVDYQSGPGKVGFMVSVPKADENGVATGSSGSGTVTRFGPVDNSTLHADQAIARAAIYRGASQYHVLSLTGANLSGEAMIQAQGEFVADLVDGAGVVDAGGRWVLETAWHLACALAGKPKRAGKVRAVFQTRPNAGPLSAAVRAEILKQQAAGLLSAETAMSLLGVDDLDAERERIRTEATEAATRDASAFFGAVPPAVSGDGQAGVTPALIDPLNQTGGDA